MKETPKTVTLRSPTPVPPRVEVLVGHRPQRIFQVQGVLLEAGTGFKVVRVNGRRVDAKIFPWPACEPGKGIGIVLVNTTAGETRLLGVKLRGREIAP